MEFDGNKSTIADMTISVTDGDHQPPPKSEKGIPFITISNIEKQTRKIDFTNTFFVSESYYDNLKVTRKPQRGDILYTVTGSFGIPVLIDGSTRFCFQRHIAIIRPKPEVDSEWLYYALLSSNSFHQAEKNARGAAQRTVSLKTLRDLVVTVPNLDKQRNNVLRIKLLEEKVEAFLKFKKEVLSSAQALKAAILSKALQPPQQ
jgi:type I restriction enzyme S subunit